MVGRVYKNGQYPGNIKKDNRNVSRMKKNGTQVWRFPARTDWTYPYQNQLPSGSTYNNNGGYYERNGKRISEIGMVLLETTMSKYNPLTADLPLSPGRKYADFNHPVEIPSNATHIHLSDGEDLSMISKYNYEDYDDADDRTTYMTYDIANAGRGIETGDLLAYDMSHLSRPPKPLDLNSLRIINTSHNYTTDANVIKNDPNSFVNKLHEAPYASMSILKNINNKTVIIDVNHTKIQKLLSYDTYKDFYTAFYFSGNNNNITVNINTQFEYFIDDSIAGNDHIFAFITLEGEHNTLTLNAKGNLPFWVNAVTDNIRYGMYWHPTSTIKDTHLIDDLNSVLYSEATNVIWNNDRDWISTILVTGGKTGTNRITINK